MLKVVFSVPVRETLQKDDQKLLNRNEDGRELIVFNGEERIFVMGKWFEEFNHEEKSVVLRENVQAGGMFDGDYGFAGPDDILMIPVKVIHSVSDTKTGEVVYRRGEDSGVACEAPA